MQLIGDCLAKCKSLPREWGVSCPPATLANDDEEKSAVRFGSIPRKFGKPLAIAGLLGSCAVFWVKKSIPGEPMQPNAAPEIAPTVPLATAPALSESVPEIARQVTVRVIGNPGVSSGVLIGRRGQTYQVLTCQHCLLYNYDSASENQFKVLTSDGLIHTAESLPSAQFGTLDLGLVQFTSSRNYRVVERGESEALSLGDSVYVAGFPNWHWVNPEEVQDTRDWGWQAYRLSVGEVGMILNRPLDQGYKLGYTNEIESGMSGGPVLDKEGRLVGINGRSKYPWNGMDAFVFADGSRPSVARFRQMEALSWAIPIATFDRLQRNGAANSPVSPEPPVPIRNGVETPGW